MPTTNATRVEAVRVGPEDEPDTELIDTIARLMDNALRVPGTNIRFGLDSILGLVPVIGDSAGGVIQAVLIMLAMKHYKLPKSVILKMVGNALLDMGVGSIPILGDLFDVGFKANIRNVELVRRHLKKGR